MEVWFPSPSGDSLLTAKFGVFLGVNIGGGFHRPQATLFLLPIDPDRAEGVGLIRFHRPQATLFLLPNNHLSFNGNGSKFPSPSGDSLLTRMAKIFKRIALSQVTPLP